MKNNILIYIDSELSNPCFFDFLKKISIDDVLDSRDADPFDALWVGNFNRLEAITFSKEDVEFINRLREKSFKNSFRVINDSEISSRISDDIELIAKDMIIGNVNEWPVTNLWASYKKGEFPI